MTEKYFLANQSQISNEIKGLYRQLDGKRNELNMLCCDWCQELRKQYEQYKGKRVKVVFEKVRINCLNETDIVRKEREGFIQGFSYRHGYTSYIITMDIAKVKKDGTPSKVLFPNWEMYSWQEIVSVEIVE